MEDHKSEAMEAIREITQKAIEYQNSYLKTLRLLVEAKEELLAMKKELKDREMGWEAYCTDREDKMRGEIDDVLAETVNKTNREDLL